LARWHTDTPLVPKGAQTRLQQSLQAVQTVPSTPPLQRVLPGCGVSQRPSVAPVATLQMPPQQSRGFEHTSPSCAHHDEPRSQTPALQSLEQHSALEVHALPAVRQEPLKGWHFPAEQLPPQHSALLVQAPLSETHALPSQTPLLHWKEQQSVAALQGAPAATHLPMVDTQLWSTWSQIPEQHSLPAAHDRPVARHAPPLASVSAPPLGPSEDKPPQLATIKATLKSQKKRVGMTILLAGSRGAQSRCSDRLQRGDHIDAPPATSVPRLDFASIRARAAPRSTRRWSLA